MPTNKQAIDWITRTLAFLGACCVVTVCVLAYRGQEIPPELNTLTGGLVGSLASMLVKTTPTEAIKPVGDLPAKVSIQQQDNQPVPVIETPAASDH